jgi:hypothetical protein
MIPLLVPLALGAAAGIGKYFASDKPRYDAEKKLASETQRYSPWTGLQAQAPRNPSMFENVLQGGMTGLQLGQGISALGGAAGAGEEVASAAGSGAGKYGLGVNTDFGVASNFGLPSATSATTAMGGVGGPSTWSLLQKKPNANGPFFT